MSMILCTNCGEVVDSDNDPEGFYVKDGEYWCKGCRERSGWNEMQWELEQKEITNAEH